MKRMTHGRNRRTTNKHQENVSILSFSAICIAASLLRSSTFNCTADNFN